MYKHELLWGLVRTSLLLTFKSDFLKIPRIGVQDGKIEISQTLSQQNPLETILANTRLSSFDLIFSKIIIFFNFHLREAFKPPKNVLDTLAS